jgi:hypothetical protein
LALLRLRLVTLMALAWLLPLAGTAAASNPAFRISLAPAIQYDTAHTVSPLAPGFVGVSMEYCDLLPAIVESSAQPGASPTANPVLTNLVAGLAPGQRPVLRLGGDSTDHGYWNANAPLAQNPGRCPFRRYALGPGIISAIGALARALDAQLILGLNLKAHNPSLAAAEAAVLAHSLGAPARQFDTGLGSLDLAFQSNFIEAFEIGNEPDLYRLYGAADGFDRYLKDFSTWAATARASAGSARVIAGPSLGRLGLPWISGANAPNWERFLAGQAAPKLLTFHFYPLLKGDCPGPLCPSMANLLADGASIGLAEQVAPFVAATPPSATVRVDEMNSVTKEGTPGVSDTFASALWALDALFEFEAAGVDGVNVQTIPGAAYALFDHLSSGAWLVRPEYYGLKLFSLASPAGSQLLSVSGETPGMSVWATRSEGGRVRIVVINKTVHRRRVVLSGSATGASTFTISRLLAPSNADAPNCQPPYRHTGLCATAGVKLGGHGFGPAAAGRTHGDQTSTGLLPTPSQSQLPPCASAQASYSCALPGPDSVIVLNVQAGSAAMLTSG